MSPLPPRPDVPGPPPEPGVDERPRATWQWWQALIVYVLALFLGAAVLGAFLLDATGPVEGERLLLVTLASQVVSAGALVAWLQSSHPGWRRAMGRAARPLREVGIGVALGGATVIVTAFLIGFLQNVLSQLSGREVEPPEQLPGDLAGVGVVLAVVVAVLGAPVAEELFYRGALYRALADRHGVLLGTIVSAVLFAGSHYAGGPWQNAMLLVGVMFFVGVFFAQLYERRGNLLANIAAHATFNAIGVYFIVIQGAG